ncbi:MAG: sigma-54 dependent transcriptional regulator [Aquabacterium sp.]|jgi:DNA-binding NtrC family response regulator|uniref:sigma-54 dependent transcriptional regulator n=1 Tax=Aquabacterium sp. TaxID=1872578 RepID=UPI002A36822D|nr:sigma-54 dependent transcriptional regulator [Aquabacterium sp.]MDX9844636.1 sigma-54 dependent transcriptional regulator [Aquabacterium sp.]
MTPQKVLCLSRGASVAALAEQLRAQGWLALPANDLGEAQRILSRERVQVGLLCLWDCAPLELDRVEACLLGLPLEWVALVPVDALTSPDLCHLLLDHVFDHHTHPVDWDALSVTLRHALCRAELRARTAASPCDVRLMGMAGHSPAMNRLRQQIRKVAATDAPVLIGGESGSGKELTARAIHQCSLRSGQPFVAVNCGAIAPTLIQSELFGHERGAFTGATTARQGLIEAANGGTIFLDEVADLPLELQTNLLRFLQEHTIQRVGATRSVTVDVRVIAASHVDLSQAVVAGRFREDLFYRLNVLPLVVPSLRERVEDISVLAQHFLHQCLQQGYSRRVAGFSVEAREAMLAYPWPGNVRELGNRVQRAVVMSEQRLISPADLGLAAPSASSALGLDAARLQAEREAIALTLGRMAHNVTRAARELGVSRMTLYRLMDKHGLHARAD